VFLYRQALEQSAQPREIGLERQALFAEAGIPLASDGLTAFGSTRLFSETFAAWPKHGQAFVQRRQVVVNRFQCLLAGAALAFCPLCHGGRRDKLCVSLATLGVGTAETRAVRAQEQVMQLHPEGLGSLRAVGLELEAADVGR
jgi:hypothetical protein